MAYKAILRPFLSVPLLVCFILGLCSCVSSVELLDSDEIGSDKHQSLIVWRLKITDAIGDWRGVRTRVVLGDPDPGSLDHYVVDNRDDEWTEKDGVSYYDALYVMAAVPDNYQLTNIVVLGIGYVGYKHDFRMQNFEGPSFQVNAGELVFLGEFLYERTEQDERKGKLITNYTPVAFEQAMNLLRNRFPKLYARFHSRNKVVRAW